VLENYKTIWVGLGCNCITFSSLHNHCLSLLVALIQRIHPSSIGAGPSQVLVMGNDKLPGAWQWKVNCQNAGNGRSWSVRQIMMAEFIEQVILL